MQGYQYGHIEVYSRVGKPGHDGNGAAKRRNGTTAWAVEDVLAEAAREDGACDHVARAGVAPLVFPGTCSSFKQLRARHKKACEAKESYVYTNPKTRKKSTRRRKVRRDAPTLYSSVFSLPIRSEDALRDPALMSECLRACRIARNWEEVRFAQSGGELAMSVVHLDEDKVHVYIYGLNLSGGTVRDLHPGRAAQHHVLRGSGGLGLPDKERKKRGDRAYCEAMRGWQDDLQADVSAKIGLTRYGPKRRRLTRAEWQAEKAAAEAKARIDEEYLATKRAVASAKQVVATAAELADLAEAEKAAAEARSAETIAQSMEVLEQQMDVSREGVELKVRAEELDERAAEIEREERALQGKKKAVSDRAAALTTYLEGAPELLANGAVAGAESDGSSFPRDARGLGDINKLRSAERAREMLPTSFVSKVEELWGQARTRAIAAAQEAARAFEPEGLLGPWKDAFLLIRRGLLKQQKTAGETVDRDANSTPGERAAFALAVALREEEPDLASALRQAVPSARLMQKKSAKIARQEAANAGRGRLE